jgi:crotonobetainyl-CoA:carnitine CoA-transferase CaiB-like acyl-CoA transferase
MGTGMWCSIAIISSLFNRQKTGKGCVIDTALYETAISWMNYHIASYHATGVLPKPQGSGVQGMSPYQAYECTDGYLVIAAPNDKLFNLLKGVMGSPEWADEERFSTNPKRYENKAALNELMTAIVSQHPRVFWQHKLDDVGIPNAPIQSVDEVLDDPQTQSLGIVQESVENAMKLVGLPMKFDGKRPPLRNEAPELGANNDEFKNNR